MPAKRTSTLWKHFVPLTKEKAWCKYCEGTITKTDHSTGNLARHLKSCKPKLYADYRKTVVKKKKKNEAKKRQLEVCLNSCSV